MQRLAKPSSFTGRAGSIPAPSALCPHCKLVHDGKVITHCPDKLPWTSAERAELRRRFAAGPHRLTPHHGDYAAQREAFLDA